MLKTYTIITIDKRKGDGINFIQFKEITDLKKYMKRKKISSIRAYVQETQRDTLEVTNYYITVNV